MRRSERRRRRGREVGPRQIEPERTRSTRVMRLARFASRNAIALAAFLAAVHLILALLTFLPQPHTGGDNATYITLGRSLLERQAFLSLHDPAAPPHTQYPPVFPGLLALAMLFGAQPWVQLKILMAVMSAAAVAMSFLWVRRRRRPVLALAVGVVLALSPGVVEQAHWILSDVPFWLFTMVAIWGFERVPRELRGRFALAVAATALAYFTRSAGLPLLVAAWGWFALRRRWRQLVVLALVTLPPALLWWLRARSHGGVDYVSQFWFVNPYAPELGRIGAVDLLDRVVENGSKYARIHLPILLTGTVGTVPIVLSLGTLVLGLFGWARRLRRPALAEVFLAGYLALLLVWPAVWSGERFLLPALPALLCYAGDALARVVRRLKPRMILIAGAIATGAMVVAMMPTTARSMRFSGMCMLEYRAGDRYPCMVPAWRDFFDVAVWTRDALPEGAAVLSRKPRLFYVISDGHPGVNYPMSPEPAELIRTAAGAGARYIVLDHLDRLSQAYLAPAVLGRVTAFCLMHISPLDGTLVLGVLPGADTMRDTPATDATNVNLPQCDAGYWRPGAASDSSGAQR